LAGSQTRLRAQAGSPHLVQAFVGFNQPNTLGLPCAGCLGYPATTVWVQPNQFVSSGSNGLYYAVFQENGWSGDLSAAFNLIGAGGVIQTTILNGTIANEQDLLVLSGNATIPETTYSGPNKLVVTTTTTPSDGSSPFSLISSVDMEVGAAGIRRLVQVFGGLSAGKTFGCSCVHCGPPGAAWVEPDLFPGPGTGAVEYVLFQADSWLGTVSTTIDTIEAGKIVQTTGLGGEIAGYLSRSVAWFGVDASPAGPEYAGPATMRVTTTAASELGSGQPFTLQSFCPLNIQ